MFGRPFTSQEDQFIRDNYLIMPAKAISKILGRTEGTARQRMKILGIVVPKEVAQQFKKANQFKKGTKPKNKGKRLEEYMKPELIEKVKSTQFKKGHQPHNTKHDNCISLRVDARGKVYKWIRLKERVWQQLHVYNWLKAGNEIPEGYILRFKDGNTLNAKLNNLQLMHRGESLKLNRAARGTGVKDEAAARKKARRQLPKIEREMIKRQRQAEKEKAKAERLKQKLEKEKAFAQKFLQEKKRFETKKIDLSKCIAVRINHKTVIYVKPGTDIEKIKKQFTKAA